MKTSPQLETSPVKELVRAGHELAAAMGADTPIIEIAKLVSRLATELDVQSAMVRQLTASSAITDIIVERLRQQSDEGWTPKNDDMYKLGTLSTAAACYATRAFSTSAYKATIPQAWPWSPHWWKPTNPRRDLVKAGALIAAEIERIDRQSVQMKEVQHED
ncbi:hypothetical protein [Citrobacter freundii]|uniref:hypothetical protein n=1 Tax=Citrobacter freundii TaxID=546 RepID=UPI0023B08D7A|nr:hypothetical protein [Citrobacter freundii]